VIDHDTSLLLGKLVLGRSVASLATLHEGRPFASMIPYVVLVSGRDPDADEDAGDAGSLVLVSHVSRLSPHTRDMLATPEVCLLVTAPVPTDPSGPPPQALPQAKPRPFRQRCIHITHVTGTTWCVAMQTHV
jgi:hypothetical protein